jgi:hypothetical protein
MKYLVARKKGLTFRFVAHLDITKMLADGTTPNPAWTIERSWSKPPRNPNETVAQWNARLDGWLIGVRNDFKDACNDALAALIETADPGIALPQEGQTF